MKKLLSLVSLALLPLTGVAGTVTLTNGASSAACGNFNSLSQDAQGNITVNVTGDCFLAATDGNTGGDGSGDGADGDGGGQVSPPPPPPPQDGGDACVTGNDIICKGPVETGGYRLPSFERSGLTTLERGKIHVYSFVYRSSIGEGQIGPMFGGKRIVKISTTPGDISSASGGCYRVQRNNLSTLFYEDAANPRSGFACDLHDGVRYYLNFKSVLTTNDTYRLFGNAGF